MLVDSEGWSGEGAFTQTVVEVLRTIEHVAAMKVENAPATRSDADYNLIANEIFITFVTAVRKEPIKRLGIIPGSRSIIEPVMTLDGLEKVLEAADGIGPADYADQGMLQYLRTERVIPPYQTKGYKIVELLRIYESRTSPLGAEKTVVSFVLG